ncbi:MAG TPA: hypothetical protein PL037_05295 [Elusimicrobiales bacterium]|nr:hypothetical protein [Elusimicrobiales bacterium]
MRSIFKTVIFVLPVALISTYLLTSPKRTAVPSDLRDAVAADQLSAEAGPQAQPVPDQPINPAPDAEAMGTAATDEVSEAKGRCSDHHNNLPGCPGYCNKHPEHRSCDLPFHCRNNMQLHACKMHCVKYPTANGCKKDKSAATEDAAFDEGLAKANCATNPNAPGCPMYCKDHHAYPGCPMFCQLNPLHPSCKHVPAYCGTNPNGYGCNKSAGQDEAVTPEDEAEAKGRCSDHHNNLPGCPGYCNKHPEHRSCDLPFHCRNNMQLHACKMHCVKYPTANGCKKDKSAEDSAFDQDLAKDNCAAYPNAPGCPMYCKDHHAYPGCPMYCQLNPMSPACKK